MAMHYEFLELLPFATERDSLFSEEEFLDLQLFLCEKPEAGTVIPGTEGCRYGGLSQVALGGEREGKTRRSEGHLFPLHSAGKNRVGDGLREGEAERCPA